MVLECDGKIGKLAESISETREKVRALKERGYSSMVHEVRAISVDADRHHLRAFGMPTDTGSANDATAAVPYKTDDQMPDDSQNSHSNLLEGVDTKSPEALAHSGMSEIPEGRQTMCLASICSRQMSLLSPLSFCEFKIIWRCSCGGFSHLAVFCWVLCSPPISNVGGMIG